MSDDGVLRIPIQLNGKGGSPSNMKLLDRELFINNSTGVLYYGDADGNAHIITVKDYNHGGKLFNFGAVPGEKSDGSKAVLGGLAITTDEDSGGYVFQPWAVDDGGVGDYNVQFSGIKLGSLVLTKWNYGDEAMMNNIKNPQKGQIFFLIP